VKAVLTVSTALATVILAACGGESETSPDASSPTTRTQRNKEIHESLPEYPGATLVREYFVADADKPNVFARDFATPDSFEDIFFFYRDELAAEGWQQDPNELMFRKDGDLVRVDIWGPELKPLGSGFQVTDISTGPAGTRFYFGVAVTSDPTVYGAKSN
jgi:hypothetical protein